MATNTPNFNLIKPDLTDIVDIGDLNDNMDIIDTALADAASVEVSTTPPSSPESGDLWWDSTEGALYVYYDDGDSAQWVSTAGTGIAIGYRYVSTVYFTSSGTFEKADYPWLRAIRVKCQAGGGGGGGCSITGVSEGSLGTGGGGGGYAESFITDIAGLASSVTVTRGAGGDGGTAGNNAGSAGGSSSFGSLVAAAGGLGGGGATAAAVLFRTPVAGGDGTTGDLLVPGAPSLLATLNVSQSIFVQSTGGGSFLGAGALARTSNGNGIAGKAFGGGGSAGANGVSQGTARAGGDGGNGIVIVELYA
jgi:hypothetical protein